MESLIGPTSHYFYSQRLKLHYVDWGNSDKPALLLLHGGRDHARNWDWVAQELRRDYRIIAPDLRGHGDSQWVIGGGYSMIDYTLDVAQFGRSAGAGSVHHNRAFPRWFDRAAVCGYLSGPCQEDSRHRGVGAAAGVYR